MKSAITGLAINDVNEVFGRMDEIVLEIDHGEIIQILKIRNEITRGPILEFIAEMLPFLTRFYLKAEPYQKIYDTLVEKGYKVYLLTGMASGFFTNVHYLYASLP